MKFLTNQTSNEINLLPPSYQEYLAEEERRRLIIILIGLFSVFLVCLSLVLWSVKIYVSGEAQNQKVLFRGAQSEFRASQARQTEKDLVSANQILDRLSSFYEDRLDYSALLERIAQYLPQEVYLEGLSVNYLSQEEGIKVSLRGFSPSREVLSELKSNLEREADFKDLDFPPSNWINPDNFLINFIFKP